MIDIEGQKMNHEMVDKSQMNQVRQELLQM